MLPLNLYIFSHLELCFWDFKSKVFKVCLTIIWALGVVGAKRSSPNFASLSKLVNFYPPSLKSLENLWCSSSQSPQWSIPDAATIGVLSEKVLEISQNSQENTCAGVSFLIKLQAFRFRYPLKISENLSVNFAKFLRTPFSRTPLEDCFWTNTQENISQPGVIDTAISDQSLIYSLYLAS